MDIAKYFDSIDKNILLKILKRKIKKLSIKIYTGVISSKDARILPTSHSNTFSDYCFRNMKIGDYIAVVGRINGISEVEIDFCQVL